jgi:glycosyltransferase involved in cell wall biosynthesis
VDFDPAMVRRVQEHPLCVGVWAYPHHARLIEGAHRLVPLVRGWDTAAFGRGERTVVLSASAGLPKKEWPTLVGAFAELARAGVDCRIVAGRTHLFDDQPDIVRQLIAESGARVMLSIDVPHDQVLALLSRTAAVVYTLAPGATFGMPRSVIEGMYAGTSVVMPERPESELTAGPECRTYRVPGDIVRHVQAIMAGGAAVEAERRANREFAASQFADPALASEFAADLAKALSRWRAD